MVTETDGSLRAICSAYRLRFEFLRTDAEVDDCARRSGLHIFRQLAKHPHCFFDEVAHGIWVRLP